MQSISAARGRGRPHSRTQTLFGFVVEINLAQAIAHAQFSRNLDLRPVLCHLRFAVARDPSSPLGALMWHVSC